MQIKFIPPTSNQPPSLFRKALVLVTAVALAAVAIMFSAILLSVILILAVFGGAYLWWKTRELRKMMRNFTPPQGAVMRGDAFAGEASKGEVFEGEVVRVDEPRVRKKR
jgi:hypothetical protein